MIQVFSGANADSVWTQIAAAFGNGNRATRQVSRAGLTSEILHAGLSVRDPRQRWVISRRRPINVAFAIAEVIWIVTGRNDGEFLTFFNRSYGKHAGPGPVYPGGYGWRLRHHLGQDQLERAYRALKHNPDSRQVILQIWDANTDMPHEDGLPTSQDVPCNIVSLLKVRNGALEWTQVLRSNDVFKGLPYNFVQFTALQEIMAGWLGLRLGTYNQISDSLHVYDEDLPDVINSEPLSHIANDDDIGLPKAESEKTFVELAARAERLIQPGLAAQELLELSDWPTAEAPFRNMLRVLCAEAARRHGHLALAEPMMVECTNPALSALWARWLARVGSTRQAAGPRDPLLGQP